MTTERIIKMLELERSRVRNDKAEDSIDIALAITEAINTLERQPKIIRCKDCRFHARDMTCIHENEWGREPSRNDHDPDWFCADGRPE